MKRMLHLAAVLMASGVFCGCGHTDVARLYSLRAAVGETPAAEVPRAATQLLILDRVRVADYLRRPQLVQRLGPHQVRYLEYDRWVGTLEQELDDVLLEALASSLEGTRTVVREAGREADRAIRIKVEILQMELDAEGAARLKARWSRSDEHGIAHIVSVRETGAIGAAHRANLDHLAARIADAVLASVPAPDNRDR